MLARVRTDGRHDSGTFDVKNPHLGGADGSIRLSEELAHGANAGLSKAMGYVEQIKKAHPILSYADRELTSYHRAADGA